MSTRKPSSTQRLRARTGKRGRKLDPEKLLPLIFARIAAGESVASVMRSRDMPSAWTFWQWMLSNETWRQAYYSARTERAEVYAEEICELADALMRKGARLTAEMIGACRLQIDSRKWTAARMLPKQYGDHVQIEHRGSIDLLSELARREAVQ